MEPTGDCKACTTVVDDDAAAAAVVEAPSDVEEEEEGVCPPVVEDDSVDSFLAPSLIVDDQHQSFNVQKNLRQKRTRLLNIYIHPHTQRI